MQALTGLSGLSGLIGSSFSPTGVAGLALWLKADAGLYQDSAGTTPATANNDPVGRWEDQSGAGRHHTQSSSSKRPTLQLAAQNGLPAVRFDGSDDTLAAALALSGLTAATVFLTLRIDADPPATAASSGLWDYGTASTTHFPYTDGVIYDDFASNNRKTTVDPATTLAQWNLYAVGSQSGQWTSWLNGTQQYTTASNTVAWNSAADSRLGSNSAESAFLQGHLGELLLYDSFLSAGNRLLIEAYLRSRWATP